MDHLHLLYYFIIISFILFLIIYPISSGRSKSVSPAVINPTLQYLYNHNRRFLLAVMLLYFAAMTFGGVIFWIAINHGK